MSLLGARAYVRWAMFSWCRVVAEVRDVKEDWAERVVTADDDGYE
jgi:hypothetical protein